MTNGSDRIRQIILGLRNFSRLDEAEYKQVDIHEGLENTLLIVQHRLKSYSREIAIVKNYAQLPPIQCYANQLNQVFMNLLNNAIDALEECEGKDDLSLSIRTETDGKQVQISISDNGIGISEEVQERLFDPFFTTKEVGKGTGLGMAIAHSIITEKHGGAIACHSELGKGTEFIISLPLS